MTLTHLTTLVTSVLADGVIDNNEIAALKAEFDRDGTVSTEEATALFTLNDAVSGKNPSAEWNTFFLTTLETYFLAQGAEGEVTTTEFNFLKEHVGTDGQVDANEATLLVTLATKANSTPDGFLNYVLGAVVSHAKTQTEMTPTLFAQVEAVVLGKASADGVNVSHTEAAYLFELNDHFAGKVPAQWSSFFASTLGSYYLTDVASPGSVDDNEVTQLHTRLTANGKVDEAEKALLTHLKEQSTGPLPEKLTALLQQYL